MSVLRIAVAKSPKRIRVRDGDALLEHAKVLQFRSRCHDLIDQELRPAEQRVEEARLKLREAEVAAEQVKLALKAIGLQERKAAGRSGWWRPSGKARLPSPSFDALRTGFETALRASSG